jgi:phosphoserine phosphatase
LRSHDLIAFDIDGTLIHGPRHRTVWEVLNERFTGRADQNEERYALYRAGKLSYAEWVELDVTGWRDAGATRDDISEACSTLRLLPGTREVLDLLAASGYRLIAISGTLDVMLETVLPDHPFEEVYTNHLGFDESGAISHWRATPFDMEGKATLLRAIAMREGIPLSRCAFVGDSANDEWIARAAGFSIALNPDSEKLERAVDAVIHADDLRAILPHFPTADPGAG